MKSVRDIAMRIFSIARSKYSIAAAVFASFFALLTWINPQFATYSGLMDTFRDKRFDAYEEKFAETNGVIFFPTQFIDEDFGRTVKSMSAYVNIYDILNVAKFVDMNSADAVLIELESNLNMASYLGLVGDVQKSSDRYVLCLAILDNLEEKLKEDKKTRLYKAKSDIYIRLYYAGYDRKINLRRARSAVEQYLQRNDLSDWERNDALEAAKSYEGLNYKDFDDKYIMVCKAHQVRINMANSDFYNRDKKYLLDKSIIYLNAYKACGGDENLESSIKLLNEALEAGYMSPGYEDFFTYMREHYSDRGISSEA